MRTLKYFLTDATKQKAIVHQIYVIVSFLQAKVKNGILEKLGSRYTYYIPEYSNYFGSSLRLLKSIYVITNSGKLFDDELTEWLLEEGFIQSQCQMSIYYKYSPDGTKLLSYIMFMTVSIGILLKLLENGLWIL